MEVDIQTIGKAFVPIRISIELETPDEAVELWHRLNLPHDMLSHEDYDSSRLVPRVSSTIRAWSALDKAIKDQGY